MGVVRPVLCRGLGTSSGREQLVNFFSAPHSWSVTNSKGVPDTYLPRTPHTDQTGRGLCALTASNPVF